MDVIDRTTLGEYQTIGSIWGGIIALEPFPFANNAAQLDAMLGLDYGDRFMFSKMVTLPIATVAANIVALYKDKWLNTVAALGVSPIADIGAGSSKRTTETINKTEARNNSRDDVNKVSAFNSDELITNDGTTSTGEDDLTGETQRTLTESNISLINAFNNLSLLDKSNILKLANKDVASYLTLDIY